MATVAGNTEMEKAEALTSALHLLFTSHATHIWVYALRQALQPTQMSVYQRAAVEQLVREHSTAMLAITELHRVHHKATPSPDGYHLYPRPSTTT